MNTQHIKKLCERIIAGFDLDDRFGDNIDARHAAEEDGCNCAHEIMVMMEEAEKKKVYEILANAANVYHSDKSKYREYWEDRVEDVLNLFEEVDGRFVEHFV